jgi:hypothetical protein
MAPLSQVLLDLALVLGLASQLVPVWVVVLGWASVLAL